MGVDGFANVVQNLGENSDLSDFKVLLDVVFVSGGHSRTLHPSYDGSSGADL